MRPGRFRVPPPRAAASVLLLPPLLLGLAGRSGAAASVAAPAAPSGAVAEGAFDGGEARLEARLLVHPDDVAPGDVRVGVWLAPDPGWHFYARDPGESGLPTQLRFRVRGGEMGALRWPEPSTFEEEAGFTTFGYARPVLLAGVLRTDRDASGSRVAVAVEVNALLCRLRCIPATLRLERTLAATAASGGVAATPGEVERVRALFGAAPASDPRGAGTAADAEAGGPATELLWVLALAVLGGLLLNAMPCVLPVLAIKVFAVAELSRRDRREVLAHAAAYATGILASMLVLALAVLALRAAGTAVGWGFQFQEPLYLAAVATLLVLFAANLFGAFEIGAPGGRLAELGQRAVGPRRSFFEGLLAVALATPCSAPFLGTAVGFAFAASGPTVIGVFLCVGLGLAAPFVLVSLVPGAARALPRSGPWMLTLRRALGFALLASTVWLLWILGRTAGADTTAAVLALLWAVAAGAFAFGRIQASRPAWARAAAALALAVLAFGAVDVISLEPAPGAGAERAAAAGPLAAEPWTPGVESVPLARGRPVFVYFTADWCLTCKVNERAVLADPRVAAARTRHDVAVFRGDWTRRDEAIRAELARIGRAGVPVYLVYGPASPDRPRVLPELLSVDRLVGAFAAAAGSGARTAGRVSAVTDFPDGGAMQARAVTGRSR